MILRPTKARDVRRIAPRMREWDRIEADAFGRTPAEALELGRVGSTWGATVVIDGQPEAMLGVTPGDMLSGRGVPWFLGTDIVAHRHRDWLQYGPDVVSMMHRDYSMLTNLVARANMRARAWLCRTGFQFDDEPVEVSGVTMLRFWRHR